MGRGRLGPWPVHAAGGLEDVDAGGLEDAACAPQVFFFFWQVNLTIHIN